jgi:hypothetical protein
MQNAIRSNLRLIILVVVIPIVIFTGYATLPKTTNYNSRFKDNFLNGCDNTGAGARLCSCVYSALQREYTYSQALEINNHPSSQFSQAAAKRLVGECEK